MDREKSIDKICGVENSVNSLIKYVAQKSVNLLIR